MRLRCVIQGVVLTGIVAALVAYAGSGLNAQITDSEGYITSANWLAVGPFSQSFGCGTGSGNSIAPSFIGCEYPEGEEPLRLGYDSGLASSTGVHPSAPGGDEPEWYVWDDGVDDGILNLDQGPIGDLSNHMIWVATYVENLGGEVEINLCAGSDDGVQIWINDMMVHDNGICRDHSLSCQDTVPVTLPDSGLYCIRAGIWENGGGWDFSLALQDEFFTPIVDGDPDWIFHGTERPSDFEDAVVPFEEKPGSATECPFCTIGVTDLTCELGQDLTVSWTNPEDCDCTDEIEVQINGELVASVSPDTDSVDIDESELPLGLSTISVVNCNGVSSTCTVTLEDVLEGDWSTADIADSGLEGSASVEQVGSDPPTFDMEITGSGHDIWDNADDFRYVWQEVDAMDGVTIQARLESFEFATNEWGKAGLMMRTDDTQGSSYVFNMFRPGPSGSLTHGSALQWRDTPDGGAAWDGSSLTEYELPMWLRATYFEGLVSAFVAPDTGDVPEEADWIPVIPPDHLLDLNGSETFLVGIAVTSHDDNAVQTAVFSDVTLEVVEVGEVCSPVQNLTCTLNSEATIDLAWDDPEGCSNDIKILAAGEEIAVLEPGTTSYTVDEEFPIGAVTITVDNGSLANDSCIVNVPEVLEGGWSTADIADTGQEGSASSLRVEDEPPAFDMEITGSGHDIWDTADDFRYVWKFVEVTDEITIEARLDSFEFATNEWAKAGLMMRADTMQGSPYVFNMFRPGPSGSVTHGSTIQWRDAPGGGADWGGALTEYELPMWLRLTYVDGLVSGFVAFDTGDVPDEADWIPTDAPDHFLTLDGSDTFLVGVAVTSHDDNAVQTAMFSQVTLSCLDSDCGGEPPPVGASLKPGDVNFDGGFNLTDMVTELDFLFAGGGDLPECYLVPGTSTLSPTGLAILDYTGDGGVNLSDAVAGLNGLFAGGPPHALGEGCVQVQGSCTDSCTP